MKNYEVLSLETHLFFARIMKEHALFLLAGIPAVNGEHVRRADMLRQQFENFLKTAVETANGVVSKKVLKSGELFTEFTEKAERSTSRLTGIPIDNGITIQERLLNPCRSEERREDEALSGRSCGTHLTGRVRMMNQKAIGLLNDLIDFKEAGTKGITDCRVSSLILPLLADHVLREANHYLRILDAGSGGI